jgi:hypothetical protein
MADFDETALQRLKALVEKSQSAGKLPPAEALELKELKLLRDAAALAKTRARLAAERRKLADREKYRLGALALAAGLSSWSEAELKGGFAMLASLSQTMRAALAAQGQASGTGSTDFTVAVTLQPQAPDQMPFLAPTTGQEGPVQAEPSNPPPPARDGAGGGL